MTAPGATATFCPDYPDGQHAWYTSPYTGTTICAACAFIR